ITLQNVVTYDTVIGVNNADLKLKPGMTANVSIIGAQRNNVLKISNAALRFRLPEATPPTIAAAEHRSRKPGEHQGERTVYVLERSTARPVQIKTGISDGIYTEALDGLKEGDRLITAVTGKLSDAAHAPNNPFISSSPRRF